MHAYSGLDKAKWPSGCFSWMNLIGAGSASGSLWSTTSSRMTTGTKHGIAWPLGQCPYLLVKL